jgi:hypothetical protein
LGIEPDLVYVDASHETSDVIRDVETALGLFPNSQIIGDDWDWESVRRAVQDIVCRNPRLLLEENGKSWWLTRNQESPRREMEA